MQRIDGVFLLDKDSQRRVWSKHWTTNGIRETHELEALRAAIAAPLDGFVHHAASNAISVFEWHGDVGYFVTVGSEFNLVMAADVVNTITTTIRRVIRSCEPTAAQLLNALDLVAVALDEMFSDGGILLVDDADQAVERVDAVFGKHASAKLDEARASVVSAAASFVGLRQSGEAASV